MGKATRVREREDQGAPTPEQQLRNRYARVQVKDPEQASPIIVRRNLTSRALERLFDRAAIDDRQFTAGDRYRTDYERAGFQQRVTSRYDIVTAGGQAGAYQAPGPGTLIQMDAWTRWRAARDVIDPALRAGFDHVVIDDGLIGDLDPGQDRLRLWTRHSWVPALKLCLDRLVRHYRL